MMESWNRESQIALSWKGPLEVTWSNPLLRPVQPQLDHEAGKDGAAEESMG